MHSFILLLLVIAVNAVNAAEPPKLGNADTDAWSRHAQVGDGILPPAAEAAQAISFDGLCFREQGRPTFVASGSIHYARVPRELWRDRLLRLKRLGFTWVETYVFWNWHETVEGTFDFTGDRDLAAFLGLARELGLRVLVRVGPYSCAEWTEGGFPSWLRSRDGMRLRVDDSRYLTAVERWFDRLLPVVAAAQVHRGGAVGMVQLENEHPHGGGTSANEHGRAYFARLLAVARRHAIAVPIFFSGLHHSHDPAGEKPWDPTGRSNPWLSTEFWTVWYSNRGAADAGTLRGKDRATWKMIAFGAGGYNLYMAHGGTTFGTWNNDEVAASYDFGAPIGQIGDIRPLGTRLFQANTFATTCADLLFGAPRTVAGPEPVPGVRSWERSGPAGTIRFLDNPTDAPCRVEVPEGGSLVLAPGEIAPLFMGVQVDEVFTIASCAGRVLARLRDDAVTTLVLRLASGDQASVVVRAAGLGSAGMARVELAAAGAPAVHELVSGARRLRIVTLAQERIARTWIVDGDNGPTIVVGSGLPVSCSGGRLVAEVGDDVVLSIDRTGIVSWEAAASPAQPPLPALGAWSMRRADQGASVVLPADGWSAPGEPRQIGLDGGTAAWAWYRAVLDLPQGGSGVLRLSQLADRGQVFIDGLPVGRVTPDADGVPVQLAPGRHDVAVFAGHDGRDKMFFNTGVMATNDRKGLFGAPRLLVAGSGGGPTGAWRWRPYRGTGAPSAEELTASTSGPEWADVAWGADMFNRSKGRALAIAQFGALRGSLTEVRFTAVDDHAEVWCNGVRLGDHRGWRDPFTLAIPATALRPEGNVLAVVVGNSDGPGGFGGPAAVAAWDPMPGTGDGVVRGWSSREFEQAPSAGEWQPQVGATAPGVPCYWRTTFALGALPWRDLRLAWGRLGRGQVWLNGHALGRFPDPIDRRGLWLPLPWLRSDAVNELVVFDAEGGSPEGVGVVADGESSGPFLLYRPRGPARP
jgi:beta-galactosidase